MALEKSVAVTAELSHRSASFYPLQHIGLTFVSLFMGSTHARTPLEHMQVIFFFHNLDVVTKMSFMTPSDRAFSLASDLYKRSKDISFSSDPISTKGWAYFALLLSEGAENG